MKQSSILKKTAACFLVLTILCCFGFNSSLKSQASAVSTLEDKYSQLEKQLAALKTEMSKTQNKKNQQLQYKKQLDTEISIVEQQIDNLNSQTAALNTQIAQNQAKLAGKEEEISQNDELFKARLRAMYLMGDASVWEVIFGAKSFSEFLKNAEYMKRLAQNDQQIMDKLDLDRQSIIAARKVIESSKAKLEANKQTLNSKKATLNSKYAESQKLLNSLAQEENSLRNEQIRINEEMKKIDEEIRKLIAASQSKEEYVGGQFLWPVPNYSTITSKFGWRILYGRNNWHTGIDISGAGVFGKPIVAANDGTVITAVTSYISGRGYGKYVIIDHGGGYTTLYGHCTSLNVRVGQTVKRGDTIAYVGSTGNSTGPHLHFGIYVNGKEVDPLPYL